MNNILTSSRSRSSVGRQPHWTPTGGASAENGVPLWRCDDPLAKSASSRQLAMKMRISCSSSQVGGRSQRVDGPKGSRRPLPPPRLTGRRRKSVASWYSPRDSCAPISLADQPRHQAAEPSKQKAILQRRASNPRSGSSRREDRQGDHVRGRFDRVVASKQTRVEHRFALGHQGLDSSAIAGGGKAGCRWRRQQDHTSVWVIGRCMRCTGPIWPVRSAPT